MLLAAVQLGMRKGHAAMEVPRCERVGLPDGNQTWYTQELPAWAVLNDDNGSFLQFNLSSPTDVGFGQAVVDGSQGSSDASTAIAVDEDLPPVALHCIGSSNQAVHVVPSGGGAVAAYLKAASWWTRTYIGCGEALHHLIMIGNYKCLQAGHLEVETSPSCRYRV